MRPTILTFNLPEDRLSKLRFLCMKLGLAVKPVPEVDFSQPIAALCGLAERTEAAPAGTADSAGTFAGEMLVFCHMDNGQVNRFLQTARQMRFAPVALKAVLTPTNAQWTPVQLQEELNSEREAVRKGHTAHED